MITSLLYITYSCVLFYCGYRFCIMIYNPKMLKKHSYQLIDELDKCTNNLKESVKDREVEYISFVNSLYTLSEKYNLTEIKDNLDKQMSIIYKKFCEMGVSDENQMKIFVKQKIENMVINNIQKEKDYVKKDENKETNLEINDILDKISKIGLDGLSEMEKEFLNKQSKQ